jgi:hypothetical protein
MPKQPAGTPPRWMMSNKSNSGSRSLAPVPPWKVERGDEDEVEQVREVAKSEVAAAKVEKGIEGEKNDKESEDEDSTSGRVGL